MPLVCLVAKGAFDIRQRVFETRLFRTTPLDITPVNRLIAVIGNAW
jgi:hypothetical protein